MKKALLIFTICLGLLSGCAANNKMPTSDTNGKANSVNSVSSNGDKEMAKINVITAEQGKNMLAENPDIVLVDVRTEEEFNEGHIQGSILIPNFEIVERAPSELPDKAATIILYCRSGNRSNQAAQALLELGYTNIYDMGGLQSWPYEIVQ